MVLLHGFTKKTQATPKKDLDIARARQKEVERVAQKRVLAWRLQQEMTRQGVSKSEMAKRVTYSDG